MSKAAVEKKLADVAAKLDRARQELSIIDEQLAVMVDEADDLRIRALVAETPLANKEHAEAHRHAQAMQASRDHVAASIEDLLRRRDDLLDQWASEDS